MADSTDEALRQILASCQVQDTFSDAILEQGWTVDQICNDGLGAVSGALVPFQKASLKWAWAKCQQRRETPSPAATEPAAASTDNTSSSWTESFAPKLTSGVVASLKSSFKRSYPAEILTAENTVVVIALW